MELGGTQYRMNPPWRTPVWFRSFQSVSPICEKAWSYAWFHVWFHMNSRDIRLFAKSLTALLIYIIIRLTMFQTHLWPNLAKPFRPHPSIIKNRVLHVAHASDYNGFQTHEILYHDITWYHSAFASPPPSHQFYQHSGKKESMYYGFAFGPMIDRVS